MNRNVKVTTNAGSYPVQIGSGIFSDFLEKRLSSSKTERIFLVIDKNVYNLHRERIENTLQTLMFLTRNTCFRKENKASRLRSGKKSLISFWNIR